MNQYLGTIQYDLNRPFRSFTKTPPSLNLQMETETREKTDSDEEEGELEKEKRLKMVRIVEQLRGRTSEGVAEIAWGKLILWTKRLRRWEGGF